MVERTNTLDRRSFLAGSIAIATSTTLLSLTPQDAYAVTAAEKRAEAEQALSKLKVLEEELADATDNYTNAKDAQDSAEGKMKRAQKRIKKATKQIEELQDKLGSRARSMYRNGSTSFFDLLMGATSFQAFATNWEILNDMNESDAEMVQKTKDLRSEVTAQKEVYSDQAKKAKAEASTASNVMSQAESLVSEMQETYESLSEEAKELYKQEAAAREARAAMENQNKATVIRNTNTSNKATNDEDDDSSNDSSDNEPTEDDNQQDDNTTTENKPEEQENSDSSNESTPTVAGNSIINRATSQLGVRYSYGAGMPGVAFDCSGFVGYAVTGRSGHPLGGTGSIIGLTRVSNPRPGDICVVHNSSRQHCGIYVSPGTMIHAPHTGAVVSYGAITSDMVYVRY